MTQVKLSVIFLKSKTITDTSTSHTQGHPLTELFILVLLGTCGHYCLQFTDEEMEGFYFSGSN